ncbi:macrophage mannose receptor 1-like isoform X1 [Acipenser ruthenus]|uniref:macrophage mannose receptor 1-like isoform X1 n=1 Tax=Acipenser ruthenus TaxID=7906 RepID=UPI002740706F|nr:macrophage mannose receptor 1-like isoform X1 [Acipenser ruthenus]
MWRLFLFLVAAFASFGSLAGCPNRRYHIVTVDMDWYTALQHCKSLNMELVSILNAEEQEAVFRIYSRVGSDMWIGLKKDFQSNFKWSSNDLPSYQKWASGQPDNSKHCGTMTSSGEWKTLTCTDNKNFICVAGPSALCDQREYVLVNTPLNQQAALSYCRQYHTDLVSITSKDVFLDIEQLTTKNTEQDHWIGLRKNTSTGSWFWENGETFNYTYWKSDEPKNELCTILKTNGNDFENWIVNNCDNQKSFICYKDNSTAVESSSQSSSTAKTPGNISAPVTPFFQASTETENNSTAVESSSQSSSTAKTPGNTLAPVTPFYQAPTETENAVQTTNQSADVSVTIEHTSSQTPTENISVPEELHLISDSMVWPEAWQYCRDHYTDLVSLTSLAVQNRVSELVRNSTASRFWTGLHRTVVYDKWYWVAGNDKRAPLNYTNWAPGEPNNPYYEHCGEMVLREDGGAEWNDLCCYEKLPFICFKEL